MPAIRLTAAALALANLAPLAAQTWQQRVTTVAPPQRSNHAMAPIGNGWHALFGGQDATSTALGDTWVWDGAQWLLPSPAVSPAPRTAAAMAQCSEGTLLFGGELNGIYLNDTWVFDGVDWQQQSPATVPIGRSHHAMAYDSTRDRVVVFGGLTSPQNPTDETWEWDGSDWQPIGTNPTPTARHSTMLAFDLMRQRTLLFGGFDIVDRNDTWEWDGQSWQEIFPNSSPYPRRASGMVYHPGRQRIVMVGGHLDGFGVFDQTREWDGAVWHQVSPTTLPPARSHFAMVYDGRDATAFGGTDATAVFGDTWSYGPAGIPGAVTFFGQGCGSPPLSLANPTGNRLAIGQTFAAELRNVPGNAGIAFVAFGLSAQIFAGGSLPLSLAPFGLPGCELLQDNAITTAYPTTLPGGNVATFSVALPSGPYVGLDFFAQGWVIATGVNPAGILTSDAFQLTVGS